MLFQDLAVADLVDGRQPGGRQLVETVLAAEDARADASPGEHLGHQRQHPRIRDADHLRRRTGGVRERPEEVEHGGHAQLLANAHHERRGGVEHRREHEPDAGLGETPLDTRGIEVDTHAEFLEDVRRAAHRRRGSIAVLGHRNAASRNDDRGHGGDVERAGAVSAGSARVDDRLRWMDLVRELQHRLGEPDDLVDRLALRAKRHQEPPHLRRCRLALHQRAYRLGRFLGRQRFPRGEPRQEGGPEVRVVPVHGQGTVAEELLG